MRLLLTLAWLLCLASPAEAGARLEAIKARGHLVCGVAPNAPGLSAKDAKGAYAGFEPDLCRAIAIAIFGAPKVQFRDASTARAFLEDEGVDVVLRGLSWSFAREANSALRFGPIYLHDGQTFLVRADLRVKTLAALSGKTVCVARETFADFLPPLQRAFAAKALVLKTSIADTRAEAAALFFSGGCDAFTADATELAEALIAERAAPGRYAILSDEITKEPLAPLLRKGDDQFFDIVRWAIFALIDAEELGLSSKTLDAKREAADPDVAAFLAAASPGFAPGWTASLVRTLGNYGEIFERHLGAASPARLGRGVNRPWTRGGLLYAPPLR